MDDSQSLHRKWLFHQTSIYKWLFGVPGSLGLAKTLGTKWIRKLHKGPPTKIQTVDYFWTVNHKVSAGPNGPTALAVFKLNFWQVTSLKGHLDGALLLSSSFSLFWWAKRRENSIIVGQPRLKSCRKASWLSSLKIPIKNSWSLEDSLKH